MTIATTDSPEARELLARVCAAIGFTAPREDQTLIAWADEVLDSPLAPRGGAPWRAGYEATFDAMQAALVGSEPIVRARLGDALAIVREHGNRFCSCSPRPTAVREPTTGRELCPRCHLRQR